MTSEITHQELLQKCEEMAKLYRGFDLSLYDHSSAQKHLRPNPFTLLTKEERIRFNQQTIESLDQLVKEEKETCDNSKIVKTNSEVKKNGIGSSYFHSSAELVV